MTNDDFLDSEDYWKEDFTVKFIRVNPDGSEWWQVRNPTLNNVVSCNSMLQAFKIAYLAKELLENDCIKAKINANGSAILKAEWLLYVSKKTEYKEHKQNKDRFYRGKWHLNNKPID